MNRGISQSAISLYRGCPYAYKLHYVDRVESMFFNYDILDVGRYVHDAIDRYYKNYYLSSGTPEDVLEKSYQALKEVWDVTLPPEMFKKAYDCLKNHSEWESKNINNGIGVKPLTEVKIDGGGFFGIVDYISLQDKKLIDWKTNKFPTLSYVYRMQAHVYKTLFESEFGEKLTHFFFYFLYTNAWRCVKFDDEKQREVGKEVDRLLEGIHECKFPKEPRTGSGCKSCNYRFYCKISLGEEEDVSEEEEY